MSFISVRFGYQAVDMIAALCCVKGIRNMRKLNPNVKYCHNDLRYRGYNKLFGRCG